MSEIDPVIQHLMDIKVDIAEIKTTLEDYPQLKARVDKHGQEILKSRTERKVIRGLLYFILITMPAAVAALVKILNP